jgi:Flp pilus assembly protein TadG
MSGRNEPLLRRFARSERGVAATELALWLAALLLPILNAVDLGFYAYQRMQVDMAGHAAVNAAWHDCNPAPAAAGATAAPPPAIVKCKAVVTGVITDMQTAAQSTSLGNSVSLPTSAISEGYYCATSTGSLTLITSIGTADSPPKTAPSVPNCPGTTTPAGDYIAATVTYTYKPLFSTASISSLLGSTITRTAWMRLDK